MTEHQYDELISAAISLGGAAYDAGISTENETLRAKAGAVLFYTNQLEAAAWTDIPAPLELFQGAQTTGREFIAELNDFDARVKAQIKKSARESFETLDKLIKITTDDGSASENNAENAP